jgi:hypothetical protein
MRTISFDKEALNITIHNQYPDLELTSLVYYCDKTVCHVSPSQQIDASSIMEASFGIVSEHKTVKGALLYKLQRKYAHGTDNQPNSSTVSTVNTATCIYLLVVCDIGRREYGFYVCLIECANDFIWNENELWALHNEYGKKFRKDHKDNIITWLMNDGTLMKTRFDVTYGSDYKLDVIISEGTWRHDTKEPMKFDLKR